MFIPEELLNEIPDTVEIHLDQVKEFLKYGKIPEKLISTYYGKRNYPLNVILFTNPAYNIWIK